MMWLFLLAACANQTGFEFNASSKVAVVTGDFDHIRASLERISLNPVTWDGIASVATWDPDYDGSQMQLQVEDLLTNQSALNGYNSLFLASGARGMGDRVYNQPLDDSHLVRDPAVAENLRNFVDRGKVVVATDWTYDLVEAAWPDALDMLGDDAVLDGAQRGATGTVQATIPYAPLAELFGADTLVTEFNFSNWAVAEAAGPDAEILMSGDVAWETEDEVRTELANVPLAIAYQPPGAKGLVVWTAFHLDAQHPVLVDTLLRAAIIRFDVAAPEGE